MLLTIFERQIVFSSLPALLDLEINVQILNIFKLNRWVEVVLEDEERILIL